MTDKPQKLCFVISPIGADGSPERDAADWFLEIVGEALGADYRIERADALKKSGQITTQIIELIESADLIVALPAVRYDETANLSPWVLRCQCRRPRFAQAVAAANAIPPPCRDTYKRHGRGALSRYDYRLETAAA